jgi:hypothetical protein
MFHARSGSIRNAIALLLLLAIGIVAVGVAPAGSRAQRGEESREPAPQSPFATVFGPNVRANTDNTQFGQHEPGLAVSRTNPNVVFTAAKDYREGNIKRVWIHGSTDGGLTWPVQLHMPNLPPTETESDPVVMARDDGRIYVSCLTTGNEGIWITWTDDNGTTWQPSVPIVQNQSGLQDKDWFAIDNNPSSPYYHRMYMMYAPNASSIVEQHSTDGGLTWSTRQQISATNTEYTYPVIASDGTVYNFMMNNWGGGRTGTVQMTKSTNGGVTWSAPQTVTTAQQPTSPIRPGDNYRFFAILSAAVDPNDHDPSTRDIYVAWTDNRNFNQNGTDVVYVKSSNGGATWGPVTRLSHDPTGVVRDHITPMMVVGADSRVHAFWLDRRLDPNNNLYDSWYSSSTDGGATWEPDVRVSTVSQDMDVGFPPGSGNAAGDYWGLDVVGNTIYVAWNDTRTGDQDILVARGTTGGGPSPTPVSTATGTATQPAATATTTNTVPPSVTVTGVSTAASTVTPIPSTSTATTTVTPIPTPCAGVWRVHPAPQSAGDLFDIEAFGPTNVWVLGEGGLYNWNGVNWLAHTYPVPEGQGGSLSALSGWSPTDIWAGGSWADIGGNLHPLVEHWDGSSWSIVGQWEDLPEGGTLDDIKAISAIGPGEAWAAGGVFFGGAPIVRHCTLTGCTSRPAPYFRGELHAVDGTSANDAWVAGITTVGNSLLHHWDGTQWITTTAPLVGTIDDIEMLAPNDIWAIGDTGIVHWDGSTWSQDTGAVGGRALDGASPTDIWAVGNVVQHYDGKRWTIVTGVPSALLYGVSAVSDSEAWAAGVESTSGVSRVLNYSEQHYADVQPADTFHSYIEYMTCLGIMVGYPCGAPGESCDIYDRPYFRANANITRGQISKIVSNAAGFQEPVSGQTYEDVTPSNSFYLFVERLTARGIVSGYPCGGPGELCGPGNRPYFRPNTPTTRGQISKIVSNAAGFQEPVSGQTYEDVGSGHVFYEFIERLTSRGVMSGYACGLPGEPCGPGNRPYFRPSAVATRGQTSKIVANTFFPGCCNTR